MISLKAKSLIAMLLGFALAIGGVMGFIKAQSLASLFMGGGLGVLLAICGTGIRYNHLISLILSILICLVLTLFFGYRFYLTQLPFPPGVFCLASLMVFVLLVLPKK